jgi:hypothetical protein
MKGIEQVCYLKVRTRPNPSHISYALMVLIRFVSFFFSWPGHN